MRPPVRATDPPLDALAARAERLARGGRAMLGITGKPGAGKSTLAAALATAVGPDAVVVPMDGFHLPNAVLAARDLADRKGAPETFDLEGYSALLARLRRTPDATVLVPVFDRRVEEPTPDALAVTAAHRLVVTEGNYLLLGTGGWDAVRPLLDEVWFVDTGDEVRVRRLVARHEEFGKAPQDAQRWVQVSDERNARLVAATRDLADLVVRMP